MENTDQREKFLSDVYVLRPGDDSYICVCEGNQYEIGKVTPARPNKDGSVNPGAVLISINGETERWIPKSVLAVDSEETLYIMEWYYGKYF